MNWIFVDLGSLADQLADNLSNHSLLRGTGHNRHILMSLEPQTLG